MHIKGTEAVGQGATVVVRQPRHQPFPRQPKEVAGLEGVLQPQDQNTVAVVVEEEEFHHSRDLFPHQRLQVVGELAVQALLQPPYQDQDQRWIAKNSR